MSETPKELVQKRFCVFCGSIADSKEHVFAKRLCKRAGAVRFPIVVGLSTDGKKTLTRKQHEIEGVQVRHVCRICNNTWMNELETWFESRLGYLIEPKWPKLALTIIESVQKERKQLALWLLKTAVMFSFASLQGELRVNFGSETTTKIRNGILPDNCWVDLAYSEYSTVGGIIGRGFHVINGGKYFAFQTLPQGDFRFTIQFNHLLLRIARAPNANVCYLTKRGEVPVRIYPTPNIHGNFAYENLSIFEEAVILNTWLGCRGNIA